MSKNLELVKPTYEELEQLVAMQAEALLAQRELDYTLSGKVTGPQIERVAELQEQALSASAESVSAFRAKETEPLRRQIAIDHAALKECRTFIKCEEIPSCEALQAIEIAISNTQTTAEAYDREFAARVLEEIMLRIPAKKFYSAQDDQDDECFKIGWNSACDEILNELRAQSAQKKKENK